MFIALKKDKNVSIFSDLDPIFKSYSNITKVIDDSVRCYKEEALEKSKNCKTKRNLKFFSLKLKQPGQIESVQNFKNIVLYQGICTI